MRLLVDQLLFGYQDGHRILGGSVNLDSRDTALLLSTTDAVVGQDVERLTTGVPLPSSGLYALSSTWAATDMERPGAVWSHTILVSKPQLAQLVQPASLLQYMRRPSGRDFRLYDGQLEIDPSISTSLEIDLRIINELFQKAGGTRDTIVITSPDLARAEGTLLALWGAQWAELRYEFSFRTRDTIKSGSSSPTLVAIARRVRGMHHPRTSAVSDELEPDNQRTAAWATQLSDSKSSLHKFTQTFGKDESADLLAFAYLANLYVIASDGDIQAVVKHLRDRHPGINSGITIKVSLLGEAHSKWWSVSELELIRTIMKTPWLIVSGERLNLTHRIGSLIKQGLARDLSDSVGPSTDESVRVSWETALYKVGTAESIREVYEDDPNLAITVLASRHDLLTDHTVWRSLTPHFAREVLDRATPGKDVIRAAARGGQFDALLAELSFIEIADSLLRAADIRLLSRLLKSLPNERLSELAPPRTSLQLAAAGALNDLEILLKSLEEERGSQDTLWLKAAAAALVLSKPGPFRASLETTFGPLHCAMTDDRLPREIWTQLDGVLPKAKDPSRRLRKLLIESLRGERWSQRGLSRAIRGSGEHITQLRKEIRKDEDIRPLVEAVLKGLDKH